MFRNVLHRTDVFVPAAVILDGMPHDVEVFHGTTLHHNPTFVVERLALGRQRGGLIREW